RVERGVGNAETEILQQPGLLHVDADLQILRAGCEGKIALDAPVEELTRLPLRRGTVGEGIAAGVVIELVFADVRIDGQQGMSVEGVLEAGGEAPGQHALVWHQSRS